MRIQRYGETGTFDQFCERHELMITAHERSRDVTHASRWYADADKLVEIRMNGILRLVCGDGATPEEAVEDFAQNMLGHRLLIGGYSGYEAVAPNEWEVA